MPLRALELAQVEEHEFFRHIISKDLSGILHDIRNAHRTDATTVDEGSVVLDVQKGLQAASNYKDSPEEKQARILLAHLGVDCDALTMGQFANLFSYFINAIRFAREGLFYCILAEAFQHFNNHSTRTVIIS